MFSAHVSSSTFRADRSIALPSPSLHACNYFFRALKSGRVSYQSHQPRPFSQQLQHSLPFSPSFVPNSSTMVGTVNGIINGTTNGTTHVTTKGACNGTLNGGVNGAAALQQLTPCQMHADIERLLFTPEQIATRVNEVGRQLAKDYADKEPVFLVVLTGAFMFASDLVRAVSPLPAGLRVEFIRASSYGNGSQSCGEVTLKSNVDPAVVEGRHVVVVEDIIDSGLTLHCLVGYLGKLNAASVKTVTLLDKKERRAVDYKADYTCFECPNEFVVGYGLDFAEKYRTLPYVGVLKEHLYK